MMGRSLNRVNMQGKGIQDRVKVLLIDDVDFFFKDNIFGHTARAGVFTSDDVLHIWSARNTLTWGDLRQLKQMEACFSFSRSTQRDKRQCSDTLNRLIVISAWYTRERSDTNTWMVFTQTRFTGTSQPLRTRRSARKGI